MQYLGVNPRSSPSDQSFHSKVPNSRKAGGGSGKFEKHTSAENAYYIGYFGLITSVLSPMWYPLM